MIEEELVPVADAGRRRIAWADDCHVCGKPGTYVKFSEGEPGGYWWKTVCDDHTN